MHPTVGCPCFKIMNDAFAMNGRKMTIKAVIFDIGDKRRVCYDVTTNIFEGGVCVGSPMAGIHAYEQKHGLPRNYINVAMYV